MGIGLVRPRTLRPVSGVWSRVLSRPVPPAFARGFASEGRRGKLVARGFARELRRGWLLLLEGANLREVVAGRFAAVFRDVAALRLAALRLAVLRLRTPPEDLAPPFRDEAFADGTRRVPPVRPVLAVLVPAFEALAVVPTGFFCDALPACLPLAGLAPAVLLRPATFRAAARSSEPAFRFDAVRFRPRPWLLDTDFLVLFLFAILMPLRLVYGFDRWP